MGRRTGRYLTRKRHPNKRVSDRRKSSTSRCVIIPGINSGSIYVEQDVLDYIFRVEYIENEQATIEDIACEFRVDQDCALGVCLRHKRIKVNMQLDGKTEKDRAKWRVTNADSHIELVGTESPKEAELLYNVRYQETEGDGRAGTAILATKKPVPKDLAEKIIERITNKRRRTLKDIWMWPAKGIAEFKRRRKKNGNTKTDSVSSLPTVKKHVPWYLKNDHPEMPHNLSLTIDEPRSIRVF